MKKKAIVITSLMAIILAIISAAAILFFLILPNLMPITCELRLWIDSQVKIGMKEFLSGTPPLVSGAIRIFNNELFKVQQGWSPCMFSKSNLTESELKNIFFYDSISCWNLFRSHENPLSGENPVVDCFKYELDYNEESGVNLRNIAEYYWNLESQSQERKSIEESEIKMIFVQDNENDENPGYAEFIDFNSDYYIDEPVTLTFSYLDWETYSSSETFSELKKECYVSFGNRYEIASENNQIKNPINASTPMYDWEDCKYDVCKPLVGDKYCIDPNDNSAKILCISTGGTYINYNDGTCEIVYSPCGFLKKSMVCCEDKIIVCVHKGGIND